MGKFVKIAVFAPVSHAEKHRRVLAENGCGKIGNYDFCSFSVRGIGRFRPLKNARPFAGKKGKVHKIIEERIETICPKAKFKKALAAIKKAHPYEKPAIDVLALYL